MMRHIVPALCLLAAACGGQAAGEGATGERILAEAPKTDAERIGFLLHERGLMQDPQVRSRVQEIAAVAAARPEAGDSVSRELRSWLEAWVRSNPARVHSAAVAQDGLPTIEERQATLDSVMAERRRASQVPLGGDSIVRVTRPPEF